MLIAVKTDTNLTNVALKKKTFQTSTYGGRRRKYYSSAQAVDGLSKTFSMTNKVRRVNPYWYVDLVPYFVSISLAYYNAAILCLPHTSNLVK
jgi:hypothetical protein